MSTRKKKKRYPLKTSSRIKTDHGVIITNRYSGMLARTVNITLPRKNPPSASQKHKYVNDGDENNIFHGV